MSTKPESIPEIPDYTPSPLGTIHEDCVKDHLQMLLVRWNEQNPKPPWWKFWKRFKPVNLYKVTRFLLECLDGLILLVEKQIEDGASKKSTVLYALDWLYEHVARECIPVLMRPFARAIKNYIIYTLISVAIDWIVEKYHRGVFKELEPPAKPQPVQIQNIKPE